MESTLTSLPPACSFAISSAEKVDMEVPLTRWLKVRLRRGERLDACERLNVLGLSCPTAHRGDVAEARTVRWCRRCR